NAVSGSITGTIAPATSNPKIYAIAGTDTLGTITDANGKFWFPGVPAGTYKLEIKPISPYVNKTIDNVTVVTGSVKDLGTITITQ
ncbi:MAG TPA: carboxypeptidase-like regulatory domain-containing protein, partial [Sphingobacteriaceae bacterium]